MCICIDSRNALWICTRKFRRYSTDVDRYSSRSDVTLLEESRRSRFLFQLKGNRYEAVVETEAPIVVRSTPYPEINRATAKMAKRCVKRGMTPDYCDVLIIVQRISEQDDLGMSEEKKRYGFPPVDGVCPFEVLDPNFNFQAPFCCRCCKATVGEEYFESLSARFFLRSVATSVFKEIIDQSRNRRIKETMRNMESLEIEIADEVSGN